MTRYILPFAFVALLFSSSCTKEYDEIINTPEQASSAQGNPKLAIFESIETGTKTSYTTANVTLASGSWSFNDALIGNTTADRKVGTQSARVRNSGKLTMNFNKPDGAGDVYIKHGKYGTDANSTWQVFYSTNNGSTWTSVGTPVTTSTTSLTNTLVKVNISGAVRLEIRKTDGSANRVNFDDISIGDFSSTTTNPVPALTTLSPSSIAAGSTTFTLTINGSNYVSGASILWNGTSLSTNFVSNTQLTTSIASSLVASAGTATISVFNPSPGGGTSNSVNFTINASTPTTSKKFLFDNRHQQTAGNADWVVDQNNNVASRYPTPAQSNITASTTETFWTGGISAWGIALAKQGHTIETLPTSGSITYGNTSNTQDLSFYNVLVIDEPNTLFTSAEKTAILQFIQNGGGLMMISNHDGSDRNNDGWDAPRIWNDFMANNAVQTNPFGFTNDLVNIVNTTSNISATASPILTGSQGTVSSIQFNNGSTITINPSVNPNVRGLIWSSGSTQNNTNIMCASSTFGSGRVFYLGDSSPTDDGTGAAGNVLYNGWGAYNHSRLLLNASLWCAQLQ